MKFKITNDSGEKYLVEEKKPVARFQKKVIEEEIKDEDQSSFTKDEIEALKDLAKIAKELVGLLEVEKDEHDEESFSEEDKKESKSEKDEEVLETEEVEEIEEKKDEDEDVLDESEELEEKGAKAHDSKRSFGSIETRKTDDSIEEDEEIAQAWRKRYGG